MKSLSQICRTRIVNYHYYYFLTVSTITASLTCKFVVHVHKFWRLNFVLMRTDCVLLINDNLFLILTKVNPIDTFHDYYPNLNLPSPHLPFRLPLFSSTSSCLNFFPTDVFFVTQQLSAECHFNPKWMATQQHPQMSSKNLEKANFNEIQLNNTCLIWREREGGR